MCWQPLLTCLVVAGSGCARSSVGDLEQAPRLEIEAGSSTEGDAIGSAMPPEGAGDLDAGLDDPVRPPETLEATVPPTRSLDAATARDAAWPDADADGGTPAVREDGSVSLPPTMMPPTMMPPMTPEGDSGTPGSAPDAGPSVPPPSQSGDACSVDDDCTQSCVPVGILPCCNELGRCGCTWAPGAYCL